MKTSLARKLVPFIIIALLASGYGIYLTKLATRQHEAAQEDWKTIQECMRERLEWTEKMVDSARFYVYSKSSMDQSQKDAANAAFVKANEAATRARDAKKLEECADAELMLSAALGEIFVALKDEPAVKEEPRYAEALEKLADAESRLTDARARFNNTILTFNKKLTTFPGKYIAPLLNIEPLEYFNAGVVTNAEEN